MGVVWLLFLVAALAMSNNLTAELEQIQKQVAKIVQAKAEVSVNESRHDSSLGIKRCSERATLADYVNGTEQYFQSGEICSAERGMEIFCFRFRVPHRHICTTPIHGV